MIGRQILSTVRYADNKAVMASTQKELQHLMDNNCRLTKKYGIQDQDVYQCL